eukprot:TRINITY_DN4556_c0_g1_i1.p1 TRINITY_DN4556_c0_g1~~TRINITY_DN4556_c0_g1_i1.p1  ORF type:complete len:609 (-),score=83.64 TRINITY_DN4556_c0_g1_i1:523-2349(-)
MTTDVLQETAQGFPSWFKPEVFLQEDFDADSQIKELGQYVPHETVRSSLEKYLDRVKQKLLEVINDDYGEFVSLSNRLSGVEGAVIRMKKPMLELKGRLQETETTIQQQLTDLQSCLQRRKEIAAAREMLELMQDAAHVLAKVEKLLQQDQQDASQPISSRTLSSRCGLLERVASEMSRLNFLTGRGSHLAFLNETADRRVAVQNQIRGILEPTLVEALKGGHGEVLSRCMHTAVLLGEIGCVEQVVRTGLVREVVERELQQRIKVDSVEGCKLGEVLPPLGKRLQAELSQLLKIIRDSSDSHRSLSQKMDIGGRCILPELDTSLQKRAQSAWSPGMPDSFLQNYNAIQMFISQTSQILAIDEAKLRSSESCQKLQGRWNLQVYYSLRFREIVSTCQDAIPTDELKPVDKPNTQQICLNFTVKIMECLERCFSDRVFIEAIGDRFLTLSMQLVTRFTFWLLEGAKRGDPSRLDELAAWARTASHEDMVVASNDALILAEFVENDYVQRIVLPKFGGDVSEVICEAYGEIVKKLSNAIKQVLTPVITSLCDKSNPILQQMKGITAMYRMTARQPPSKPSLYVSKVLKTLETFFELFQSCQFEASPILRD